MGRLRTAVGVMLVGVLVALTTAASAGAATAPPGTPRAITTGSVGPVGPLFFGALTLSHSCSASVLHSPQHNLILTAAHCVRGAGAGVAFAPGYLDGQTPEGVWTTTRAYVDSRWIANQDPRADYAILQVAPQRIAGRITQVEDVAGGYTLGFAPPAGTSVTVPAYPAGVTDAPITCTTRITLTAVYPTFDCYDYVGGTSGSPFVVGRPGQRPLVVGVIGGLHQGGCYDWNSFSSPFDLSIYRVYLRAILGARPDVAPVAGSDGC